MDTLIAQPVSGERSIPSAVLVILTFLCVFTVVQSNPTDTTIVYGRDAETITGLRSTRETFSQGGRYVLHDYSAVPSCEHCRPAKAQIDQGLRVEVSGVDYFHRAFTTTDPLWTLDTPRHIALPTSVPHLTASVVSPESPPPRG